MTDETITKAVAEAVAEKLKDIREQIDAATAKLQAAPETKLIGLASTLAPGDTAMLLHSKIIALEHVIATLVAIHDETLTQLTLAVVGLTEQLTGKEVSEEEKLLALPNINGKGMLS